MKMSLVVIVWPLGSKTRQTSRSRRDSENWVILGHTPKQPKIIDRRNVQVYILYTIYYIIYHNLLIPIISPWCWVLYPIQIVHQFPSTPCVAHRVRLIVALLAVHLSRQDRRTRHHQRFQAVGHGELDQQHPNGLDTVARCRVWCGSKKGLQLGCWTSTVLS